jgi:hypothetical protein
MASANIWATENPLQFAEWEIYVTEMGFESYDDMNLFLCAVIKQITAIRVRYWVKARWFTCDKLSARIGWDYWLKWHERVSFVRFNLKLMDVEVGFGGVWMRGLGEQPVTAVKMSANEIQSEFPSHETVMSLFHFCFLRKLP